MSFLELEDHANRLHLGAIAVIEGPVPNMADIAAHVAGRMHRAPRCRQHLRQLPLGLTRPVWADDPDFDVTNHLRHTALPAPGGIDELQAMVGRVMAEPLDRDLPLWELWIIDGVDEEHWAILTKVHHAVVADGDLFSALLDTTDTVRPPTVGAPNWRPAEGPSNLDLIRDGVGELVNELAVQMPLSIAKAAVRAPASFLGQAFTTAKGLTSMGQVATTPHHGHLAGPLSPHRNYRWFTWPLADIQRIKDALDVTVNDVVLTALALGFRDLLVARDVKVEDRRIRAMLPVSMLNQSEATPEQVAAGGTISTMFAALPVAEADPAAALEAVRRQTRQMASSGQAVAASTLSQLAGFAPPALLGLGMRAAARVAAKVDAVGIDTVITNVPGPQEPRWLLGRTLLHVFPYAPLAAPVRISVAVFSYDGELSFGITADPDAIGDLADFTAGIEAGLLELDHLASLSATA